MPHNQDRRCARSRNSPRFFQAMTNVSCAMSSLRVTEPVPLYATEHIND
jgi:hypothetical protein